VTLQAVVVAPALLLAGAAYASAQGPPGGGPPTGDDPKKCSARCRGQVRAVRRAVRRYRSFRAATRRGFRPFGGCAELSGAGAVGQHFRRPGTDRDQRLELRRPEMLHYLPTRRGREFVAVEWLVPVLVDGKPYFGQAEPPKARRSRPPRLLGRTLDGPIPPTLRNQPWHYSVHLWLFRRNPQGLFSPFNLDLHCPRANGRIAFGNDGIFTTTARGTGDRQLSGELGDGAPAWSIFGDRLAFERGPAGESDIFAMDPDGGNLTRLTSSPGRDESPAWSPRGDAVAFGSTRGGGPSGTTDIYSTDTDGQSVRRLTRQPATDRDPAWSPDGRRIVFMSDRDGDPDLYIMSARGGRTRQLTDAPGVEEDPSWALDGSAIAFHVVRGNVDDIYTIDDRGRGLRRVTRRSGPDRAPDWSPDGRRLVFERPGFGIYVIDRRGRGRLRVAAAGARPAWQPLLP
jgi:hypothetical protein